LSVGVLVEFKLKQGGAELLTSALREGLPRARMWDGNLDIFLGVDSQDPCHLFLIQKWRSRQHYEAYDAWIMAQPETKSLMAMLVGGMTTTIVEDLES